MATIQLSPFCNGGCDDVLGQVARETSRLIGRRRTMLDWNSLSYMKGKYSVALK